MCKINGKKLSEIRMKKGLSREELATKIGMSKSSIEKYEIGTANPSDKVVDKICLLLKINKNDIEIADVGYNFTSGEGKITEKIRKSKGFIRYSTPSETEKFIQEHSETSEDVELREVKCALKNSFSIASKKYILINPTFIHIPDWQRDTDMAKVQEIAQDFNEDKYDPVKVYVINGKLFVADGAHRIVAFVINGEIKMLVEVLNCNEHEAILTFLGQQSARKAMSIADTYRAGVKANIREYIDFKNLFENYNIQIVTDDNKLDNPIGKVAPSRTLLRMVKNDTETLENIIRIIKLLNWTGSEKSPFALRMFQVFKKLYANYGENMVDDELLMNCKGASYFENKIAPVKSNAEMYDILAKIITA
jgi:transcriptional regulator with XRE-family HTH domain|nr:MAG TPA: helix-turn-helix domain protein [Bacteriophage sp.]